MDKNGHGLAWVDSATGWTEQVAGVDYWSTVAQRNETHKPFDDADAVWDDAVCEVQDWDLN